MGEKSIQSFDRNICSRVLDDLGVDRILKCILTGMGLDWIHLARDRNQRRTVVNTVMNLQVP
jgi:hypothetical protein